MSELDEKLLDRIKEKLAYEKTLASWSKLSKKEEEEYWPEVCRRYAEEVSQAENRQLKNVVLSCNSDVSGLEKEISQLKKQLEDMEREKHIMDCQIRTFSKVFQEDQRTIVDLKSKLEVKEKCITCEAQEKFFDAAIAERDARIAELEKECETLAESTQQLGAELCKGDEKIKELEKDLNDLSEQFDRKCDQITEMGNHINGLKTIIAMRDEEIDRITNEYGTDYNSSIVP